MCVVAICLSRIHDYLNIRGSKGISPLFGVEYDEVCSGFSTWKYSFNSLGQAPKKVLSPLLKGFCCSRAGVSNMVCRAALSSPTGYWKWLDMESIAFGPRWMWLSAARG